MNIIKTKDELREHMANNVGGGLLTVLSDSLFQEVLYESYKADVEEELKEEWDKACIDVKFTRTELNNDFNFEGIEWKI